MSSPDYSYPPGLLVRVVRDVLLLRRRDFRRDAQACIEHLRPPLQVRGRQNIPQHGPCVITVNHYHRPGFGAQWLTLAVAALVPAPMHWIMTAEWTYPGKWYRPLAEPGSHLLLKRIAAVYGFTTMPPMPPRPGDVEARAASVRAVLDYARRAKNPLIGLAPEGYDPPSGALTQPAPGLGRFGLLLARAGLSFVPVGAFEAEEAFQLHFGEPYRLSAEAGLSADEKDERVARIVMERIACLLPPRLRGDFA